MAILWQISKCKSWCKHFLNLFKKCLNACVHVVIISLFHKTVKPFKIGKYDMYNDIVQKCLSYHYRMTLQKSVSGEKNVETVNNEWPSVEDIISETHNVYTMSEVICIWCRNSLWQKKPKMPDQACANGLKLHDIPQELDSINTSWMQNCC